MPSLLPEKEIDPQRRVHELEDYIEQLKAQTHELVDSQLVLEASRDRYAALYDFAPVGYVTFDLNGKIKQINLVGARMLDLEQKRLVAIPFHSLVVKSDVSIFAQHLIHLKRTSEPTTVKLKLKIYPDRQFSAQLITVPMTDPEDESLVYWSVINDISEREKAERERDQLLDELRAGRDRLAELSRALLQIQEDLRRGLARELHDQVSQNLTALGLALKLIETHIPPQAGDRWRTPLKDAQNLVVETTQRIRRVTSSLRPTALDFYGLSVALEGFVKSFQERTDLDVELKTDSRLPRLESNVEIALFRIAQEALTNVVKHAHASQVTITLERVAHNVRLTIVDNGIGFDRARLGPNYDSRGLGLMTISERALAIHGDCRIESEPGAGTRIIIEVPR